MQNPDIQILFLGKNDNPYATEAAALVAAAFPASLIFLGNRSEPLPEKVLQWKGDYIISFISSWVLPQYLLTAAGKGAINFHPGSPEYPGTGCTNFAVYEGAKKYGATCHYMQHTVDTGAIINVQWFNVQPEDTVYSLTQQCYRICLQQLKELINTILSGAELPLTDEKWRRKAFTRKQLNSLCEITPDMSTHEVELRIKATTYNGYWAYTKIGNRIFKLTE